MAARLNDDLSYRVYGTWSSTNGTLRTAPPGVSNHDGLYAAARRLSRRLEADATIFLTASGPISTDGSEEQFGQPNQDGRRPKHTRRGGSISSTADHWLQVQAYYDETQRFSGNGGGGFFIDMYDLDVQHSFAVGSWNDIVWGGGERSRLRIRSTNVFAFGILPDQPARSDPHQCVRSRQHVVQPIREVDGSGMKLGDDPYSGLAPLPSARISWKVSDTALLWSAVSRAVRAPTQYDRDVFEKLGTLLFLIGGKNFQSEKLTAYEIGTRIQPSSKLSFSISAFYNVYDDLRSTEPTPVTLLPLHWGNLMEGDTFGVEAWANYQVTSWWRLSAGLESAA